MKHSVDQARDLALSVLKSVTSATIPEVSDLTEAVRRFQEVEFDVPTEGDTDGFLFEYSHANWFSKPMFVLGFTRQLGLVGEDGSVDEYLQIQFEYQYRYDAELSQLKSPNSWWFREGETSFAEWLDAALCDPIWDVIREKRPVAFDLAEDFV